MDLNSLQVASAQKRSGSSGPCPLTFVQGDAENLPFPDASFDIVVNVESSHTYPHFDRFAAEVRRVLRQGGRFVITDFRERPQMPDMLSVSPLTTARNWQRGHHQKGCSFFTRGAQRQRPRSKSR
jgi:ubiquinone/menaquinone biosynthesis C-methylase UbiE